MLRPIVTIRLLDADINTIHLHDALDHPDSLFQDISDRDSLIPHC